MSVSRRLAGFACFSLLSTLVVHAQVAKRRFLDPLEGGGGPSQASFHSYLGGMLQVDPGTVDCAGTITFDDLPGGASPGTNYDAIIESGAARFAERFAGQTQDDNGAFDALLGTPTDPLTLAVGDMDENLEVFARGTHVMTGLGPLGYPSPEAIGEGAFAVLFDFDQSELAFDLVGGNGGDATVSFFKRDGTLIDNVILGGLGEESYGFRRVGDLADIAGITVVNTDPAGVALDNVCLEIVSAPCFTLDFETDDEGAPLIHGQHLGNGDPEFDGGSLYPVTLTSSVLPSGQSTAAILDSSTGPATQDPDLLVGRDNILILQTEANTSECPPGSGIYCSHNDDDDGGRLSFDFPGPVTPSGVVLIDIDSTDPTSTVVLTDGAGARRTYTVPASWTGDSVSDATTGWRLLDLTNTNDQPGFGSTATAVDDPGFDPTGVVRIDVHLGGSGGVDDLAWCPSPVALQAAWPPRASARVRAGSCVHPSVLSFDSLPVLGRPFEAILDCTAQGPGLAVLEVRQQADGGARTIHGEARMDGALVYRTARVYADWRSQLTWEVPNDVSLLGLKVYAQGLCICNASTTGPRLRLSNAVDLVLGF